MPEGASIGAGEQLYPSLGSVDLSLLCGSERFRRLDKQEAYYRCAQYNARRYDWEGNRLGFGADEMPIAPGWYVPLRMRRPSARYDLARLIVDRLTAMVFGAERFPQVVVEGDEDAQDYARELARVACINDRFQEARGKGGAQGTAVLSWGFVGGEPRAQVHNAKHATVLRWADRFAFRPAEVLEAYSYPRLVYDRSGRAREATYYYARYWSESEEVVWEPIPEEQARRPGGWLAGPRVSARHDFGFCPVYWIQNRADSDGADGDCDFEGQLERFDEVNVLLSATGKGMVANVDPTLVIKDDPATANTTGTVRKGSQNAIYSKGGAEYLELRGESLRAALELLREHKQQALDTASVVLGDPTLAAKAQSAAALRVLYLPMINEADRLRAQYGRALCAMLRDMLRAARAIGARKGGEIVTTADGQRLQVQPAVMLGPRIETSKDGSVTRRPRSPGQSEQVTLNWPPYFPNSWADIKSAADALSVASGGKAVISRRTAVENAAPIFGVADVDQELAALDEDRATDMAFAQQAFEGAEGPGAGGGAGFTGERQEGAEPDEE